MTDYFVAANGLAANSGTSRLAPWTIGKAQGASYVAGDRILLNCNDTWLGVFGFTNLNGAVGNPIIIDLYGSGRNPILDGAASSAAPVLSLKNCHNVTINNLVTQNGKNSQGLINLTTGCTNIIINNVFWDNGIRGLNAVQCGAAGILGIKILGCYGSNIKDTDAHANGGGSQIQINNCNGSGFEVANCKFYADITQNCLGIGDTISLFQSNGTAASYMLVHDNWVRGGSSHPDGYDGIGLGDVGGSYQKAYNNKICNVGNAGIQMVGGNNIICDANQIYQIYSPVSAQGITLGGFGGGTPFAYTCTNNRINCTNKNHLINNWFVAPSAPATNMSTNTPQSTPDAGITNAIIPDPLWPTGTRPWDLGGTGLVFSPMTAKVYGGSDFDPGATSSNAITYTSSNPSVATIVAGQVHIIAAGTSSITANDGTSLVTQLLTVNKAVLNVTPSNRVKNFGAANPTLISGITGYVNGDTSAVVTSQPSLSTTAVTNSPVGTYPITAAGGAAANYTFAYVAGALTINKINLIVTADSKFKDYGSANPALTTTITGFIAGESAANLTTQPSVSTPATSGSAAGNYVITASGGLSQNYTFTYVAGNMTINKVPLFIVADNKTKAFNTANPTLTATMNGFVNGDTKTILTSQPSLSTTAVAGSPIGNYPITASGAAAANYTINYVAGTLTVAAVNLVFNTIPNKPYGTPDFDPGATSGAAITYTSDNTAVATIVSGKIHIIGVGAANIKADNGSTNITRSLTVTKAPLIITADNKSIQIGDSIPGLTASYTGFVNGETNAALTTQPTISTTATGGSPVGDYPITPSLAAAANYSLIYMNGNLSIQPSGVIVFTNPVVLLT